jgi:hypothetical protein
MSLDGYIGMDDDTPDPLFDWYFNGDVEVQLRHRRWAHALSAMLGSETQVTTERNRRNYALYLRRLRRERRRQGGHGDRRGAGRRELHRRHDGRTWGGASGPAVAAGDADLIAEEPGPLAAGMGDQRLVRRQLQLELVTQERRQALLDLLGFGLGSGGSRPDRRTSSRPSGRSTLSAPR